MKIQYRPLSGRAGFDLSCQDIGALKALDIKELREKVQTSTRYKALKDDEKFTVDLSLNRIHPDQLPQLIALLDQLPGMALDLSINNFDWSDLKELLIQQFNPRGSDG